MRIAVAPGDTAIACQIPHDSRWAVGAFAVVAALVCLLPVPVAVRVAALTLLGAALPRVIPARGLALLFVTAAVAAFAFAFLLTPLAVYLGPSGEARHGLATLRREAVLVALGAAWVLALCHGARPVHLRRLAPSLAAVAGFLLLSLAFYLPSAYEELAYAGDECYHMVSIQVFWRLAKALAELPGVWLATGIWGVVMVAAAVVVVRRRSGSASRMALAAVGLATLGLAAYVAPWHYPADWLGHHMYAGRAFRFPAAQPWLSALLASLDPRCWHAQVFRYPDYRLLPWLAVCLTALPLAGAGEWRRRATGLVALALLAVLTVPNLLYHGTIVYLELPAVFLLTIILLDGRGWLTAPYPQVCGRLSWWAAVLLPFTKESVYPAVAILVAARWFAQWRRRRAAGEGSLGPLMAREAMAAVCVLTPAVLYMVIRYGQGVRPYAAAVGNWFTPELLARSLGNLAVQTGPLLAVAALGVWHEWRAGRRQGIALSLAVFAGLFLFFLAEDAVWVGLARFSLLMLPPVLVLGWRGMDGCFRRHAGLGVVVTLTVVGGNLLLSPLNLAGERRAWGNTGERWYPYTECFRDLKAMAPEARVLLANMAVGYTHGFALNYVGWDPPIAQVPPAPAETVQAAVVGALGRARREGWTAVVYRLDSPDEVMLTSPLPGAWALTGQYVSRSGRLLLFVDRERIREGITGGARRLHDPRPTTHDPR